MTSRHLPARAEEDQITPCQLGPSARRMRAQHCCFSSRRSHGPSNSFGFAAGQSEARSRSARFSHKPSIGGRATADSLGSIKSEASNMFAICSLLPVKAEKLGRFFVHLGGGKQIMPVSVCVLWAIAFGVAIIGDHQRSTMRNPTSLPTWLYCITSVLFLSMGLVLIAQP